MTERVTFNEADSVTMVGTCTVDADLFDSLQQAIDFVAERGGGVVYSELAETLLGKSLQRPDNVTLEEKRPPPGA